MPMVVVVGTTEVAEAVATATAAAAVSGYTVPAMEAARRRSVAVEARQPYSEFGPDYEDRKPERRPAVVARRPFFRQCT